MGAMVVSVKIEELSLKELKDLQRRVTKAIDEFQDRKKRQAISMLEEQANALGYSLAELAGTTDARKRMPAKVKYSNPDNSGDTWTGRGRRPLWIEVALRSGKTLADLLV